MYGVDSGSPQLTGTAQVLITVLDANNQDPVFSQEIYVFTVSEGMIYFMMNNITDYIQWQI